MYKLADSVTVSYISRIQCFDLPFVARCLCNTLPQILETAVKRILSSLAGRKPFMYFEISSLYDPETKSRQVLRLGTYPLWSDMLMVVVYVLYVPLKQSSVTNHGDGFLSCHFISLCNTSISLLCLSSLGFCFLEGRHKRISALLYLSVMYLQLHVLVARPVFTTLLMFTPKTCV